MTGPGDPLACCPVAPQPPAVSILQTLMQGPGSALPQVGTRSPEEQPDSPDAFQAKWRALRDEAMAELKTALLAMLQQALSYRGHITFPVAEGAPAGAAAVAAGVGQQAA